MSLNRYPENWKELAFAVKEAANWQCQRCGRLCLKPGETLPDTLKRRAYMLQVHHWNCDPGDNRLENLVALCSSCHLAYVLGAVTETATVQLIKDFNNNGAINEGDGDILASSRASSSSNGNINRAIQAGTYYVQVLPTFSGNNTNYNLTISV